MDAAYWKAQAKRWKKAYWASLDDSEEERRAIIAKAKAKRKTTNKATSKTSKNKKIKRKNVTKPKTGDLFGLL